MIWCYDDGTARGSSPKVANAFAKGCGGRVTQSRELLPGDLMLWGSPKIWDTVLQPGIREGRTWYYADHAFWGRFEYFRVAKNRYQHTGEGASDGRRFREVAPGLFPWRRSGGHIVVCPPDQAFGKLMGIDAKEWEKQTRLLLSQHTDRPQRWRNRLRIKTPLLKDLEGAWALVTFMSNAAVEAVCAGVPVFCTGECAARIMGLSDLTKIESPRYPEDRENWAGVLADNQWTLEEMEQGKAWDVLR